MSVVEIALTAEQLAAAYTQLSEQERRRFLKTVFSHPANQQAALELLQEARLTLERKFSPAKQQLLDRLLNKNAERELRPAEQEQLEQLIAEYGEGLIEKARAQYILNLARQATSSGR
ncbi:MAG TPA: hypothetical protein VNO70_10255 [Blastocatellia bacterium]|nr:hypothetical protein [Blastocatellia bacterium]